MNVLEAIAQRIAEFPHIDPLTAAEYRNGGRRTPTVDHADVSALVRLADELHEGPNKCWLWTGYTKTNGYGYLLWRRRNTGVHVIAYLFLVGPIPDGYELDHRCRTPLCANPEHLEPVPHKVNTLRGIGITAQNVLKTHCPQGHPYKGANLRITSQGARACRVCAREHTRAYQARKASIVA